MVHNIPRSCDAYYCLPRVDIQTSMSPGMHTCRYTYAHTKVKQQGPRSKGCIGTNEQAAPGTCACGAHSAPGCRGRSNVQDAHGQHAPAAARHWQRSPSPPPAGSYACPHHTSSPAATRRHFINAHSHAAMVKGKSQEAGSWEI